MLKYELNIYFIMPQFIIFIDFDYFFAQVEEILNPEIREKPVVVCVYSGRTETSGAVATSNYLARKIGIKSGMPLPQAMKIGKDRAVFLPIRKDLYKEWSDHIMDIISEYSDKIEIASIDEAYIDVTDSCKDFNDAVNTAQKIKDEIYNKTGVRVSVGVSVNKAIAKVLGDMAKPNGIKSVGPSEIQDFLKGLEISKIPGVGKVIGQRLNDAGVKYITDVINADRDQLINIIGTAKYNYLYDIANNTYNKPVTPREKKNFGRYMTLPENTRDVNIIIPYVKKAIDSAYEKAPGLPSELSLVAIMEDISILSRSYTGARIDKNRALEIAIGLLNRIINEDQRNIRRVGVRLGKITKNETLDDFF